MRDAIQGKDIVAVIKCTGRRKCCMIGQLIEHVVCQHELRKYVSSAELAQPPLLTLTHARKTSVGAPCQVQKMALREDVAAKSDWQKLAQLVVQIYGQRYAAASSYLNLLVQDAFWRG